MRRRFGNPAPVPSGFGSGPAAVAASPSPVSREQEEAKAVIWTPAPEFTVNLDEFMTPASDPVSNAPKKRGRPIGSKNRVKS